jgi:hypothetical protein
MAGYSGTPLIKKLGIKEDFEVALINAPAGFDKELGALPAGATVRRLARGRADFILIFVRRSSELNGRFAELASMLKPAGMLWVAWPKKAAKIETDLTFNVVQRIGLDAGLVDVKICAIDEIWSGLKFVIRLKDRRPRKDR